MKTILKNTKGVDMTYTFILNYRGGNYIEQVSAPNVLTASHIWAHRIANDAEIKHLDGQAFLKAFAVDILEFPPTAIDECRNVWQMFFFYGKNRMDVDIVKTSEAPEPANQKVSSRLQVASELSDHKPTTA